LAVQAADRCWDVQEVLWMECAPDHNGRQVRDCESRLSGGAWADHGDPQAQLAVGWMAGGQLAYHGCRRGIHSVVLVQAFGFLAGRSRIVLGGWYLSRFFTLRKAIVIM